MSVNVTWAEHSGSKVEQVDPSATGEAACANTALTINGGRQVSQSAGITDDPQPPARLLPCSPGDVLAATDGDLESPFIVVDGTRYPCRPVVPGYRELTRDAANAADLSASLLWLR